MIFSPIKFFNWCVSHQGDALHRLQSHLRWICVDHSSKWAAIRSWTVFGVFTFVVPAIIHFLVACTNCHSHHSRPYNLVIQLSFSSVATISFISLIRFFGNSKERDDSTTDPLHQFFFLNERFDNGGSVQSDYKIQINTSLHIVSYFVTPCFVAMSAYKIWWYASGRSQTPFLGNIVLSDTVACLMELCSWLYRTAVIFLVCVLFSLICHLQILRLHDFNRLLRINTHASPILSEHRRIRRHLGIISHRYRFFILCLWILVTGNQFASLLITTKANAKVNIYSAGELAICSLTLVRALVIILLSASKITHKAQALTCSASEWHVSATVDGEMTPSVAARNNNNNDNNENEGQHAAGLDREDSDDLQNDSIVPAYASSTTFQQRQALVSYFENNMAGITVYGFTLDRGTLYTIFGLQLSLTLWLLAQTVSSSSSTSARKRACESIKRTIEVFAKGFDEIYTKQANWIVEDEKLRRKISQATVRTIVSRYKSYLQSYIMLLVEDDPSSEGNHVNYTPKGLEMKLKAMFEKREDAVTERRYKHSYFVNRVMNLDFSHNSHLPVEAL